MLAASQRPHWHMFVVASCAATFNGYRVGRVWAEVSMRYKAGTHDGQSIGFTPRMCDLAGDVDFCLFGNSGLHRTVNFAGRLRTLSLLELPSFLEDYFASTQVNGKC